MTAAQEADGEVEQLVCGYYKELYGISHSCLARGAVVAIAKELTLRPAMTSLNIGRFQAMRMAMNITQAAMMVFVSSYQH